MKNKIAVITDTNSGMTMEEAEKLGIFLVPMPFLVDGVNYLEGKDLTPEMFFEKQRADVEISTSQPSPGELLKLWEDVLKSYEEIVYIPMTSGLSSSCATAMALEDSFDGKVQVVDNKRISATLRASVYDAVKFVNEGKNAVQIKEILEKDALNASIYITVDTLKYLKKGGRITAAAALAGTVLNIKPVLQIQGGLLDAYAKVRGMKKAVKVMIEAIQNDLNTRFAGMKMRVMMAYTGDRTVAEQWREEVRQYFPDEELYMAPLALSICCHTGENAIAIGCVRESVTES
ncbi:MAG: DegV family protein [Lachnospiraceae bacterium]|nr:DegV family protein [Lachnospiraceae bacterium]